MTLPHGSTTGEGPTSRETHVTGPAANLAMIGSARVVRCRAPSDSLTRAHRARLGTSGGAAGYPAVALLAPPSGILRPR
jgi:hypothetical protein